MWALTSTASPCAHHAPTLARPISVIASRTTPSVRPPACITPGVATATPAPIRVAASPMPKPLAFSAASVQPSGQAAK
jgi:hypothetical protein